MFPTRSGHKNAGFRVASFSLLLFFFSPDFIHLSSAFFLCCSACSHRIPQAVRSGRWDSLNGEAFTWAALKPLALLPEVWRCPSWCTQASMSRLGKADRMLTLPTHTLRGLRSLCSWKTPNYCSVCSVTRTHRCHQSPAVKWPSACAARCLHSILKQCTSHLLQGFGPETSILQAESGLGPWMGSLCISSA